MKVVSSNIFDCEIEFVVYAVKLMYEPPRQLKPEALCMNLLTAEACNFTKINTPPWVFFTFFKFYKWCQIAKRTTYT